MNSYSEFWNNLMYGTDSLRAGVFEARYWLAVVVFTGLCFCIGLVTRQPYKADRRREGRG